MTQVDFYSQASDKLRLACELATKAFRAAQPVVIYAPDGDDAAAIDALLWTAPAISFIPHVRAGHRLEGETPVVIAREPAEFAHHRVLINLGAEWPPFFSRFERLLEIVSSDEADRARGRLRWKFYKDRGYPLSNHDMSQSR